MSKRNGDKARFGRERKRKLLERKRIRGLQEALKNHAPRLTLAAPELAGIPPLTVEPMG